MRYEYKYLLPYEALHRIRPMMLPFLEYDNFAKRMGGQYTVRSIYFDDPRMSMYNTKQDGVPHRLKVRLRGYNLGDFNSTVFLELKRKYQGPIVKNRAPMPYHTVIEILKHGLSDHLTGLTPLQIETANRFFYQILAHRLKPIVNVVYEREAFIGKDTTLENNLRITFDKNLRAAPWPTADGLFTTAGLRYILPEFAIVEVKFNQFLPAWIKPIIDAAKIYKEPASKYVLSIDGLHDQIPTHLPHQLAYRGRMFS
jgi:hypothetical protein